MPARTEEPAVRLAHHLNEDLTILANSLPAISASLPTAHPCRHLLTDALLATARMIDETRSLVLR